jgi:hypothetical protein
VQTDRGCSPVDVVAGFRSNMLKTTLLKPSNGVHSDSTPANDIVLSPASSFPFSWRLDMGKLNGGGLPGWLKIPTTNGSSVGDAAVANVVFSALNQVPKLKDQQILNATLVFTYEAGKVTSATTVSIEAEVLAIPSMQRSTLRISSGSATVCAPGGPCKQVSKGASLSVAIAAIDEEELPVRRDGKTFTLILAKRRGNSAEIVAPYSAMDSLYSVSIPPEALDTVGEYRMWVTRIFGYNVTGASLLNHSLPFEGSPILFRVVEAVCERLDVAIIKSDSMNLTHAHLQVKVTIAGQGDADDSLNLKALLLPANVRPAEFELTSGGTTDVAIGTGGFAGVYTVPTLGSFDLDIQVNGAKCNKTEQVDISSCATGFDRDGDRCIPGGVCSQFLPRPDSSISQRGTFDNTDVLAIMYPKVAAGETLLLIPLTDAKKIPLSGKVSVDLSSLPVGAYALEMPASASLPRCPLMNNFRVHCAAGYETLNGEGMCYAESPIRTWLTGALTGLVLLCLLGLFVWIYTKRHSVKAIFTSVMQNEGMAGVQIASETLDFAGDAVLYQSVATKYRYMHVLFVCYTVFFCSAVLVSAIALGLKFKALFLQLRMRRKEFALPEPTVSTPKDRRATLVARLEAVRKEQLGVYAAVLVATLEDLPMGVLSICLSSQLPTGEKLSVINQLSIMYSWFNLGGKMLKAAGLPRLWAAEKDIQRKLAKHDTASTDAANVSAPHDSDSGADETADPALVSDSTWHRLRRWVHKAASRKHARQADAELKLLSVAVRQSHADRASRTAKLSLAAVLHDTPADDAHEPVFNSLVRATLAHSDRMRAM